MQKLNWALLEGWATKKAERFNYDDQWVDLVMWIVAERAKAERGIGRRKRYNIPTESARGRGRLVTK